VSITDHFAFAGTYPFGAPGTFGLDDLLREMDEQHIDRAFVTDIGTMFLKEPSAANVDFADTCRRRSSRLEPLAVIDLSTGVFEKDIRDLHRRLAVRAVRIAPNHHGYKLDAALAGRLMSLLAELGVALFAARSIEDLRAQPPCLGVQPLTLAEFAPLFEAVQPTVPIVLSLYPPGEIEAAWATLPPSVRFDVVAFDQSFLAMERLVEKGGPDRFVFGSHTPFLARGAALHNLRRGTLKPDDIERILHADVC
jgi:uncharacterized protein